MKIHYIGLSCFLIENEKGFRVLVDPFNDAPEWDLGPRFPREFGGRPFGANIVLSSEPDADHAYAPGGWLRHAPHTEPNSDPFPGLDLRGTVIYEHNGDVNIAYQYTIDGVRLAHFADNAHVLTPAQLKEIGSVDIVFMSPQKVQWENSEAHEVTRKNITALRPKLVVWAHHFVPQGLPQESTPEILRPFFVDYFKTNARMNKNYKGESSFIELCYLLENATHLNKEYSGVVLEDPSLDVTPELLKQGSDRPKGVLFRSMLAR